MHNDSAYTKISANSGVDQGCPLSVCGFSAVLDPILRSWRSFAHITNPALNSSLTWTIGICGSNDSICYRQLLPSLQPPDQSTFLYSPPRHKNGMALVRFPVDLSSKTSHTLTQLLG